jgi:hypothetical protein
MKNRTFWREVKLVKLSYHQKVTSTVPPKEQSRNITRRLQIHVLEQERHGYQHSVNRNVKQMGTTDNTITLATSMKYAQICSVYEICTLKHFKTFCYQQMLCYLHCWIKAYALTNSYKNKKQRKMDYKWHLKNTMWNSTKLRSHWG